MEKRETRRRLIFDLNADGSIAGALWDVILQIMEADGRTEIARKTEQREATPEEWAPYLADGTAETFADMKAAHLQIAEMQAEIKRRDALIVAKDNLIEGYRSQDASWAAQIESRLRVYDDQVNKAANA